MLTNNIANIYPHLEKFWITLETQTALGGVDWVVDNFGNKSVTVPFVNPNQNPYVQPNEKLKFEVKMMRYVVDSLIPNYIKIESIYELEIVLIKNFRFIQFPDKYALYFPTTNTLVVSPNLPVDQRVWEVSNSVVVIKFN